MLSAIHDVAINQLHASISNGRMEIRSHGGLSNEKASAEKATIQDHCLDEVDVARFIGAQAPQTSCLLRMGV